MSAESRRVLILEDEPQTMKLLVDYLRAPHLELVACSEIEAAECLMDRQRFDLLVADLEVSALGGLEGIRLIRHVSCHFPRTGVIIFSGNISQEVRALGKALGVLEVLDKPSGLGRLRSLVDAGFPERTNKPADRNGEVTRVETLAHVLRDRSVSAVLQPIMELTSDEGLPRTFGFEGLSRGPADSPLRNPEILLDLASRKEQLFDTELQCIDAVLVEGSQLPRVGNLFINTRPRTLSQPGFAEALRKLVRFHGQHESNIVLELTEQQSILNLRAFDQTLRELHECGFGLALDDYGSGFANLHLLEQLELDYLKIDGLFSDQIHLDDRKQAIVGSTVEMARDLGISTIMERVETQEELDVVRELGVDYAQGYYFSKPLPGSELAVSYQPVAPAQAVVSAASPARRGNAGSPSTASTKTVHELSNLLTGIALFATDGLKQLEPDSPLREDLERICEAGERAVELAQELHDGGDPAISVPDAASDEQSSSTDLPH